MVIEHAKKFLRVAFYGYRIRAPNFGCSLDGYFEPLN